MFRGYGPSPSGLQSSPNSSKPLMPMGPMGPMPMGMQQQQQQQGMPPQGYPSQLPPPPQSSVQMKRELPFPPESIESVTPVLSRRRKLHKNDVSPVEAWRIMMSLKSGLLAETTWALDVLNVLLYDDYSVSYFSLSYLPGLLDILLEHLKRALILLFGQSIGIDITSDKGDKPTVGIYHYNL
jgi:AT-rich interactive domain-containing protein 1